MKCPHLDYEDSCTHACKGHAPSCPFPGISCHNWDDPKGVLPNDLNPAFDPAVINNHIGLLIANITATAKYLGQALDRIAILEQEVKTLKAVADLTGPLVIHRHGPEQGIPMPDPAPPSPSYALKMTPTALIICHSSYWRKPA